MTDFLAYPSDMEDSGPEIDMLLGMLDLPRAVRDDRARELGMSPTRYAQIMVRLLKDPEVEKAHPQTVRRWRRILAARRAD